MTNPSGAGVEPQKVQNVVAYLRAQFPVEEIIHDPQGDQMADRYRVVRRGRSYTRSWCGGSSTTIILSLVKLLRP